MEAPKHFNLVNTPQLIQDSQQRQMLFPGIPTLPGNHQMAYYNNQGGALIVPCEAKTSVNTADRDSGLTYNNHNNNQFQPGAAAHRKRSRDQEFYGGHKNISDPQMMMNISSSYVVGEDILPQFQMQQHLDIDTIISQHTKRIRLELQERQKQQTKLLVAAIGEGVTKKLKEKDEQIQRIGKLNYALQERVKSLYVENQLWREVAQTNEAAANSLRTNLEQALVAQARGSGEQRIQANVVDDDVESCCGSNDDHDVGDTNNHGNVVKDASIEENGTRKCRKCGERESCVLLLPCRHLCLCNVCGSGAHQLRACPVCNSSMNATLHVNMSSN